MSMDEREMIRKLMEILEVLTEKPPIEADSHTHTERCCYCRALLVFQPHGSDCQYMKARGMLESLRLYESLS